MQADNGEAEKDLELVPFNVIRVETALSRYPVHRLAKQGMAAIEIREKSADGEVVIQWKVNHNSGFGQPGPLAYRLDTLIVNRRIEEASRPIPKVIRLGSLHELCQELGISEGKNRDNIKKALYQNASAFITAKLKYKLEGKAGGTKELEAGFTRYNVVFTGEELPDGRRADAVYLVLSEVFMQVLNGAQVRPLDYDYLKELPPASQRLYELLSFQIYGAIKNKRKDARINYAHFCTYAPLSRFVEWDQVRPQMARIHRPHLESGYIRSVRFELTTDRDGKPDWLMVYVPGRRAQAEFDGFAVKGGPRFLEIASPTLPFDETREPGSIERELIGQGITPATAAQLVKEFPEERVRKQLEQLEWQREKKNQKSPTDPAAYLVDAIRKDYAAPAGFETKADRAKRDAARQEEERRKAEAARKVREANARRDEEKAKVSTYVKGLSPEALADFETKALEAADPEERARYDKADRTVKRLLLRGIHEKYVRQVLGLPELDVD